MRNYQEQIMQETVDEMVQPAIVNPTGEVAVALFDTNHKQMFVIPRMTKEEAVQLTAQLRLWLKQGYQKLQERVEASLPRLR